MGRKKEGKSYKNKAKVLPIGRIVESKEIKHLEEQEVMMNNDTPKTKDSNINTLSHLPHYRSEREILLGSSLISAS